MLLWSKSRSSLPSFFVHTYIFINPGSRMTIQDAKTVRDEIEKGAKKN